MMDRQPVVVLRSNDVCFLGIVRSCAAAGVSVIAVQFSWVNAGPWYSDDSVHLDEIHTIPNPHEFPKMAATAMVSLGKELSERYHERLWVLGSSDTNLMFLGDNHAALLPYFRFMGDREFDRGQFQLLHKGTVATLLEEAKVAIPLTRSVTTVEDIEAAVSDMRYPCIYKPAVKDYGQTFYATHNGNKAISVQSKEQLRTFLHREIAAGFDLVVQEKIDFDKVQDEIPFYLYADKYGTICLAATGIKEKVQPHPFGTATLLRLSYHPELLSLANAVVQALEYRGILMIEFIRDRTDQQWKVIEINPRPWLFVDFFRRHGLNYLQCGLDERDGCLSTELHTPNLSEGSPIHICLPLACGDYLQTLERPPTISDVRSWLQTIVGLRSLTYWDPGDRAPGIREIERFAAGWQLEPKALLLAIEKELSNA